MNKWKEGASKQMTQPKYLGLIAGQMTIQGPQGPFTITPQQGQGVAAYLFSCFLQKCWARGYQMRQPRAILGALLHAATE